MRVFGTGIGGLLIWLWKPPGWEKSEVFFLGGGRRFWDYLYDMMDWIFAFGK